MSEENIFICECGKSFLSEKSLSLHEYSCDEVVDKEYRSAAPNQVTEEMCKSYRLNVSEGKSVDALAKVSSVSDVNIAYHVRGECTHNHGVPSLEYDNSAREWVEPE